MVSRSRVLYSSRFGPAARLLVADLSLHLFNNCNRRPRAQMPVSYANNGLCAVDIGAWLSIPERLIMVLNVPHYVT